MPPKNDAKKVPPKSQARASKAMETSAAALQARAGGTTERLAHEAAEAGRRNFEAATASAGRAAQTLLEQGGRSAEAWRTAVEHERGAAEQSIGLTADASARLTQGVQEATAVVIDVAQESLRRNVETAQSMLRCRTVEDIVRVQSDWMQGNIELVLSSGARLSAIAAGLALGRGAAAAGQRR